MANMTRKLRAKTAEENHGTQLNLNRVSLHLRELQRKDRGVTFAQPRSRERDGAKQGAKRLASYRDRRAPRPGRCGKPDLDTVHRRRRVKKSRTITTEKARRRMSRKGSDVRRIF
jgi:hypothetical protein